MTDKRNRSQLRDAPAADRPPRSGRVPEDVGRLRPVKHREQHGSTDQGVSRDVWEELSANPDLSADLGYRLDDWEQFETLDGTDQLMYLPADEQTLKQDAFLVADPDALCDLDETL